VINPRTNKVYLFAGNSVEVIDLTVNRLIGQIALPTLPPSAGLDGASGAWVNNTAHASQIILFRGNQFVVIDALTDSVMQTFSLPPTLDTRYGPVAYNGKKFYVGEISATGNHGGEVRVLDSTSFATTAIIPVPQVNGTVTSSDNPFQIVVNPGNDKVYVFYQLSGAQIIDGSSDAVVATAACTTTCNGLAFPPQINGAVINPIDNSVWVAAATFILGPGGGDDGGGGVIEGTSSVFWRIDPNTNAVVKQFQFAGYETDLLGFDPKTGLLYLMADDLPTVLNPTANDPVISAFETMLVVLDPNNATPTAADPSPMHRVTVDGTLLANTGTPFTCGNGVTAFEPITVDVAGQYIYWRCNATTASFSSIVVSKMNFTDIGGTDYSQFVAQIPTLAGGMISGHAIPVGQSMDYDFGANIGPNDTTMLFSGADNLFFEVNPVGPSLTTIPLGAEPAGIVLDVPNHRAYVTDHSAPVLSVVDTSALSLVTKTPGPGGPLIGGNGQGQYVLAGPTTIAADPGQINGAFLYDSGSNKITTALQAAATTQISVNPNTNVGYFVDGNQWVAVDLASGSRLYAVTDISPTGTDTCQMTGISVNKLTNQVWVAGKCTAFGNVVAQFDGSSGRLLDSQNADNYIQTIGRLIVNPNTNRIYVEAQNAAPLSILTYNVVVFDATFGEAQYLTTISGRMGPFAVNTVTNMVYAAGSSGGVAAIDGLAPEQASFFAPLQLASALAVDETNNNLYVTSYIAFLGTCCDPLIPVFAPAAGTVSIFHQDPATYLLQGLVTTATIPQTGITFTVTGDGGSFTQVTSTNGIFAGRLVPGTYTVTPSNPGFEFSPASQTIVLGQIDQTVPTFFATPIFHITGSVLTAAGAPVAGVTLSATGVAGSSTAVTNASGQYSLAGLPAGTYTVAPTSPVNFYSPLSESVQVNKTDVVAPQFTVNPSLQITAFTLSSNLLGTGMTATATVTVNEVAPKGGIAIALSSSNTKTVKPPTTVTIPAGASSGSFTFSGTGTGAAALTASYSGTLAVQPTSATTQVSIVSADTIHVTSATWSTSTQTLKVTATSTNAGATLNVTLASNGQALGTMTSQGNGTFTLQTQVASKPSSVNVKSTLGGSTGQGVSILP